MTSYWYALGVSQIVIGPTLERGHTMDLIFCSRPLREGLVWRQEIHPEPWSDQYLLKAKVNPAPTPHMRGGPVKMIHPWRFMNSTSFQNALGDFRIPNVFCWGCHGNVECEVPWSYQQDFPLLISHTPGIKTSLLVYYKAKWSEKRWDTSRLVLAEKLYWIWQIML